MEVTCSSGNKVLWKVLDDCVAEEGKEYDEIGLQGFDFNFLAKTRRGWLDKY